MDKYMSYQSMVTDVNSSLEILCNACNRMEMTEQRIQIQEIQERLKKHTFRVGIMGEFKRGKSTVINALLENEIVPADIIPCSATLNRIVWDSKPHAVINFKEETGRESKDIPVEQLSDYVTKLSSESEKMAEEVEDAVVYYPCRFCQNGVEIIDTPGLNDDERMNDVSERVIPTLDAIIMVLTPGSPFSMSEAAFVRNKLMTSDFGRLVFIVNKIDTVRAKDRKKVVEHIRSKIIDTVLEKTKSMYGEDSNEYKDVQEKLAGVHIFPISAINALDGKLEDDEELFESSGMKEFEEYLSKMLTDERGMLELVSPISIIMSKVKEIQSAIEMRTNAMLLDETKFKNIQDEATKRIEEQRILKKAKVDEIKAKAVSTYQDLLPMVNDAYNDIEQQLISFIEQYTFKAENFQTENDTQEFISKISDLINNQIYMVSEENIEKMQVEITTRINNEIEGLEIYSSNLSMELNEIKCLIPKASEKEFKNTGLDIAAAGLEVVTNFTNIVPGLGAAITGFRDHGVLGGIVGLGAGYVATFAGAYGVGTLLTAIGLAGTAAFLPLGLAGAGIIGAFGGKAITNTIFDFFKKPKSSHTYKLKESDLEKIRSSILQSVLDNISNIKEKQSLENWLRDTTNTTYNELSQRVDEETENTLHNLENTLEQIHLDLASNEAKREESMIRLRDTEREMLSVLEKIKPIKDKLDAAMLQPNVE